MEWKFEAWSRLANTAAGSLIVLLMGSLAARMCRQPVLRARLIVLTILGSLMAPCLAALPLAPRWSVSILPAPAAPLDTPSRTEPSPQPPALIAQSRAAIDVSEGKPDKTVEPPPPMPPRTRWSMPALSTLVLGAYASAATGLAIWWLFGQFLLWRLTRAARPVSSMVRDVFQEISGRKGSHVRLFETDRIDLPVTYSLIHPVILLPKSLCASGDSSALRYVLAHEWSHVERHDSWAWNFTCLAGIALFYQPLFWWLRRQLRLCQDYLADARAASLGSAEDYAAYLVGLARIHRSSSPLPALGISDRRSNLYRRVSMLLLDHEPLQQRCRKAWSIAAAVISAVVIVTASGLRLDAAAPPEDAVAKKVEGARTWKGRVTEKGTGKPIAGADVIVEISTSRDKVTNAFKTLREVHQTTGADGAYEFTLSPDEAGNRSLYITLHVKAREQVSYFGGYSYAMILKNEKLGERPFYENLELAAGRTIEGTVKTPEGKPAAGVRIQSYSSPDPLPSSAGAFAHTTTDAQGHFHLVLHPVGKAVFWILPQDYAPERHGLNSNRRGDLGTFTVKKGVRFGGKLVDTQGKPVAGAFVEADLVPTKRDDDNLVPQWVADQIHRATLTAADGMFEFNPLPAGDYRVYPTEGGWDPSTRDGAHQPVRRPLPAVFAPHKVTLKDGETPAPVEIRALPQVSVEAQIYNSKGEKCSGHEFWLTGKIDGEFWNTQCHPTAEGAYRLLAPKGLQEAQISLSTNEHSALQFRIKKDAPLQHSRMIRLGTLTDDVKGIEIIRYEAPIILISVMTKDGKPIKDFMPSVNYTEPEPNLGGKFVLKSGVNSDVNLEEQQPDGRIRTSQLVPDREVLVTVHADGFRLASRKLKLPEGKTDEAKFVLEPK